MKYKKAGTIITEIFREKGYFHFTDDYPSDCDNLIFYTDGTFFYNVCFGDGENHSKEIFPSASKGVYEINGDTIKANFYMEYSYLHMWSLNKLKFVILDSMHIKCILDENVGSEKRNNGYKQFPNKTYTFIPYQPLPKPETSWKTFDWLWD